jgi:hypothetical protein
MLTKHFVRIQNSKGSRKFWGRTDSTSKSSNLSAIFASMPESLHLALKIAGSGLVIAVLPVLPETKKGFVEAMDAQHREEAINSRWGWAFGALGFFGAYGGTSTFLTRIGGTNPVLAGFKTPFALFGAFLGGRLCYDLAPHMYDATGIISRFVTFTADGLIADTIGRPPNQAPAWETSHIVRILNSPEPASVDSSAIKLLGFNDVEDKNKSDGGNGGNVECIIPELPRCERLLLESIGRLIALRRREEALRSARGAASSQDTAMLRAAQEPELLAIAAEKQALKDGALFECNERLAKRIDREVRRAGDELTRMRLEQVALARELGLVALRGGAAGRDGAALAREVRQLDRRKAELKRAARRELGVNLARVARPTPSWRSVAAEARGGERRS